MGSMEVINEFKNEQKRVRREQVRSTAMAIAFVLASFAFVHLPLAK